MKKQFVLGILLIVAGLFTFLSNADIWSTRAIFGDWWPLFFIIAGVYMLWVNIRNFVLPTLVLFFGVVMLINTLDIGKVDIGAIFLPMILVGFGLSSVVSAMGIKKNNVVEPDDNIVAILGSSSSKNMSKNFTGSSVSAIMGGVELDISKAVIKKPAVLNVSIIMGGLELRVPENVKVINRTQSALGGIEDKTTPTKSDDDQTLIIQGTIVMGGVEIKR